MTRTQLFERFISDHLEQAYRFAYTYTRNQHQAEDVVSESVVKAMRSLHQLKQPESIKPWFYKIIANTALNSIRNSSRLVYLEEDQISDAVFDDYSRITLDELLQTLPPLSREIIVLRFFEDMKIKEIAAFLEENENTVKSRLYKALKQLKVEMEEEQWM